MRKNLTYITYPSFIIIGLLVVALFITSKSYLQLGVGTLLYIPLAFFGLKIFPRQKEITAESETVEQKSEVLNAEPVDVKDVDKRAFLKLVGAAGLSYFLFSLLGRRAAVPFFDKALGPGTTALTDSAGHKIDPALNQPTDGFRISEIDDNIISYYGFTNKDGAWIIMKEDTATSSFRYAKGEAEFPKSWESREKVSYDYYHNVF
jgi:hypothetical protein